MTFRLIMPLISVSVIVQFNPIKWNKDPIKIDRDQIICDRPNEMVLRSPKFDTCKLRFFLQKKGEQVFLKHSKKTTWACILKGQHVKVLTETLQLQTGQDDHWFFNCFDRNKFQLYRNKFRFCWPLWPGFVMVIILSSNNVNKSAPCLIEVEILNN